jgi:hypothetical protein
MKKTYQVELKYESYALYEVEADSPAEAEEKAWKMLDQNGSPAYGEWAIDSIEEQKK